MRKLKNEYKSFLDDIEKNIKEKEDLEYVRARFASFLDVVLDEIDCILEFKQEEMEKIENTQKQLDTKIGQMQQVIDNIEKDIYAEDGFDFEIVCPYCNYEFIIDVDENENKTEIECPECQNIIELDWSGDTEEGNQLQEEQLGGCSGSCHGCHGCEEENEDDM